MVIPLGERYQQTLYLFTKVKGKLEAEPLEPTFFVPMTGQAEALRVKKDDSGLPRLLNASFETVSDDGQLASWYYVRQAEIVGDNEAVDGERCLRFQNDTPGRGAQALQAVGVDGRRVRTLDLALWIRTTDARPGQSPQQLPRVELSFFDEKQAPAGMQIAGPWHGSIDWTKKQTRIDVPSRARLAVIAVGLFGATGQLVVDGMSLDVAERR
jgi:protein-L-isoaspartate(D-aspartate) O-methyltransferase